MATAYPTPSSRPRAGRVIRGCGIGCGGLLALLVLLVVIGLVSGPGEKQPVVASSASVSTAASTPTPTPTPTPDASTAAGMLALLPAAEGRDGGYDRTAFGWRTDVDRNGCDTRNDVLRRDLRRITYDPKTGGCVVLSGTLESRYSGQTVGFDRAHNTLDVDHVVPLADAWRSGASGWDQQRRFAFANDPLNLVTVETALNRAKGDSPTWLPPLPAQRCAYVARAIAVRHKHGLAISEEVRRAHAEQLASCPGQPADTDAYAWPARGGGDLAPSTPSAEPSSPEPEDPEPSAAPTSRGATRAPKGSGPYASCAEAKAAGAAPLRRGEPGYSPKLDGDGDGVACER